MSNMKFKSVQNLTLTYENDDHSLNTINVEEGTSVQLNGTRCSLNDLRPGDALKFENVPATAVLATRTVAPAHQAKSDAAPQRQAPPAKKFPPPPPPPPPAPPSPASVIMTTTFRSLNDRTITYENHDKTTGTVTVAEVADIQLNGNLHPLTDLQDGDTISFIGDPTSEILAKR